VDVAILQDVRGDVQSDLVLAGERLLALDALERPGRARRDDAELRQTVTPLTGQADVVDRVDGGAEWGE